MPAGLPGPERSCESAPFLTREIPPRVMISAEGLEIIEHNADRILAEVGIEIHHDATIERFRAAGASVEGTRVRFDPGLVRSLIATAPSTFTQHARNPARSVQIGGSATVFAPAYGSPFVRDLDGGRRYASIADFENFVKLTYLQPHLHHSGGTVCEPVDLPVNKRHFDMVAAHLRLSDKPFMGSVTAGERAQDTVDMAKIVFGDRIPDETFVMSLINASSPLSWDATMLDAAEIYAATQPGLRLHAVHTGRRDEPGDSGRRHGPDPGGGDGRDGGRTVGAAGCAGRARGIRVDDEHAIRCPDIRNP